MLKEDFSVLIKDKTRKSIINKAISEFGSQRALAQYLSKKLNRNIVREQIKDWKKAKHIYGWDLYIPINVLEELCKITNGDVKNILKQAIKYNPAWCDPDKKINLVREKSPELVELNGSMYLDLASVVPDKTLEAVRSRKELPLFVKANKDTVQLWSEACWKISIVNLHRFVKLDELFFEGTAIYAGEGITKYKNAYNSDVSIGNTEPAIIKIIQKWFISLLSENKLRYKIEYNGIATDELKIVNFWLNSISISQDTIKLRNRPQLGCSLKNNFGVLKIDIKNTVLKAFILKLLKVAKDLALTRKDWGIYYLRGLIAAEGSVTKDRLSAVTIGSTNPSERSFIKNLLLFLGLKCTFGKNQLQTTDWSSFIKLLEYDAFRIPQVNGISKKDRFVDGLNNHEKTKRLLPLKKFRNSTFTSNDWQQINNLKFYNSACKMLKKLSSENYLITSKSYKYTYEINKSKLPFLEQLWSLKGV